MNGMRWSVVALALASTSWLCNSLNYMKPGDCNPKYAFCNASLAFKERAADLVSRLTLEEKVIQLSTYSFFKPGIMNHSGRTPGIERLGVPEYNYHTEGLHGIRDASVADMFNSTLFPQVTAMSATGNLTLIQAMGEVMGTEFRAVNNALRNSNTIASKGGGLSVYGPTINIIRDGRWGRNQESVSEDPWYSGEYAAAYIKGLQGDVAGEGQGYLKVAGTCKHLAAYSVETNRHDSNAVVSDLDLHETYLPAFHACLRSEPQQIMCSYNQINGVPACLNGAIQNDIVRGEWRFNGSIVSDCDAIRDVVTSQKIMDGPEAVAKGISGGCDQDCGSYYGAYGLEAVQKGLVTEAEVDVALERALEMRFRLGEFGDVAPYSSIPPSAVGSSAHKALAKQAAQEAITLLANTASVLPIALEKTIALIGPLADSNSVMMGGKPDYSCGKPCHPTSVKEALTALVGASVQFVAGLKDVKDTRHSGFEEAVTAAKAADVSVLVLGIDPSVEKEGIDRPNGSLTGAQEALLHAIVGAVGAKRVILVLINGGPIYIDLAGLPTMIEAYELGQYGGAAIADVLFGKVNPSGVLPYSMYYPNITDQLPLTEFAMRSNDTYPGRTYRFSTAPVMFPFGFGLSYTDFQLTWSDAGPSEVAVSDLHNGIQAHAVRVANIGKVAGSKVIQAYTTRLQASKDEPSAPFKSLFGAQKIFLQPGASTIVRFSTETQAGSCPFCVVEATGVALLKPGPISISIGIDGALSKKLSVTGKAQVVSHKSGSPAALATFI